ncbi:MAG: hypothetical protein AAF756_21145, partial [Pseudomonadota bacterium]
MTDSESGSLQQSNLQDAAGGVGTNNVATQNIHNFASSPGNSSSRDFFEPLGTVASAGQTLTGTAAGELLSGEVSPSASGLPGA